MVADPDWAAIALLNSRGARIGAEIAHPGARRPAQGLEGEDLCLWVQAAHAQRELTPIGANVDDGIERKPGMIRSCSVEAATRVRRNGPRYARTHSTRSSFLRNSTG